MIAGEDIAEAFRLCGVRRGDVLMLHADAIVLAQLPPMTPQARFDVLFDALDAVLGPEGTLVVPTFTYSFTKGEPFDPATTPSTVGPITEAFRTRPGVRRSGDPIFSVAARGRLAQAFAETETDDCFGPASAFALLAAHDAWLACLGCGFRVTFTHYAEQRRGVDYRYFKTFDGVRIENGAEIPSSVRYLVRDLARRTLTDLSQLKRELVRAGTFATAAVGRVGVGAVRCGAFEAGVDALLTRNPHGLIEEGS